MAGELELRLRDRLAKLKQLHLPGAGISDEVRRTEQQLAEADTGDERSEDEIWRSVEFARHPDRPYTLDYVERLVGDFEGEGLLFSLFNSHRGSSHDTDPFFRSPAF